MKMFSMYLPLLVLFLTTSGFTADFYVSINGNNENDGTLRLPFKTISKACSVMVTGDNCYIRKGTYRESIQPLTDGVTFKNYKNEYVLVTGLDEITGWKSWSGGIDTVSMPQKVTQVFVNGKRMNWARFPDNNADDMFSKEELKDVETSYIKSGDSYHGTVTIPNLPQKQNDFWSGAWFVGVANNSNWFTSNKGQVISSNSNSVTCNPISFNWRWNAKTIEEDGKNPMFIGKGLGYIIGHLGALTSPKEWVWQDSILYLYAPQNAVTIEGRTRTFGLEIEKRKSIAVVGIHFKAAALKLDSSDNCSIKNCTVRYAGSFPIYTATAWGDFKNGDGGIYISGKDNRIEDCYVGQTWSHGISLWGEKNTVENCIIESCDWIGERMSPIFSAGDYNEIRYNTIRHFGRDGIDLGNSMSFGPRKYSKNAKVFNNHVYDGGKFSPDGGLLYVNHQGGTNPTANTEIAYNIMHDYPKFWGPIYLDNGSSGYTIHHNILKNARAGVNINSKWANYTSHDIHICHNTFIDMELGAIRWETDSIEGKEYNIVVKNNHSTTTSKYPFNGIDTSNNREINISEFIDFGANDYRLKETSPSINAGVFIPGINDDAIGLPDIGAYEFNGYDWTAGSTIEIPNFIDENEQQVDNTSYINKVDKSINIRNIGKKIVFRMNNNSPWNIEVFDLLGRKHFEKKEITDRSIAISKDKLSHGMYCLIVKSDGQRVVNKISISH